MSARRPSFDKRERDRAKKAKAAAKREKRFDKGAEDSPEGIEVPAGGSAGGPSDQQSLLDQLERLLKRYEDEQLGFD